MMRTLFALVLLVAAALALPWPPQAQDGYPSRAITLVVPVPPGGAADFIARTSARSFRRRSASRSLSATAAAPAAPSPPTTSPRRAPDGYTLLLNSITTHGIGPHLYTKLPYDSVKDFTPIMLVASCRWS